MRKVIFLLAVLVFISCSTEPKPIQYGVDACDFCEMTIVNEAFAARAVSTKGKQFKYDAIECMLNDLQQKEIDMAVQQVANYAHPGEMLDVAKAIFIINDSINSPMGAHLAAFEKKDHLKNNSDGLSWENLWNLFLQKEHPGHTSEK